MVVDRSDLSDATYSVVSSHVDDQTQSVLVKGLVQNSHGALRSSQYVRVRLVWKTVEGIVVPVTAVLRINGRHFAFVAEEAKGGDGQPALVARQRPITVGTIVGDNYTVHSGLAPGDRVIVSGVQRLADGAPISPQR